MTFTATPTVFEIYCNDTNNLAAKVTMFDEGGAQIEINLCWDRHTFDEIVPTIQQALSAMKLTGDI
jgi:hypothetical protein